MIPGLVRDVLAAEGNVLVLRGTDVFEHVVIIVVDVVCANLLFGYGAHKSIIAYLQQAFNQKLKSRSAPILMAVSR